MHWIRVALGMSAVVLLLAACGVVSQHPLTDEKTSILDARLIGIWEGVPKKDEDPEKTPKDPQRLYVGRHAEKENTLEAVFVQIEEERVQVQRFDVFTTELGAHRYASGGRSELGYVILLYDAEQADRIQAYALQEEVVEAAIGKGLVEGEVTRKKTEGLIEMEIKTVRLTAKPESLAAWLKDYSPACFEMDDGVTFRRVRVEK